MSSTDGSDQTKIYIYHPDHEHDRTYTENLVEYLTSRNVLWRSITVGQDGNRPELLLCVDDRATAVVGFNALLDHSWIGPRNFLDVAWDHGIPVLQWILDHPSARWPEFGHSTAANSRFLLNSEQHQQYFQTCCLPDALTAVTGGVGPNQRSRAATLTAKAYLQRPFPCMIPLNLRRIRGINETEAAIAALEPSLARVVHDAIAAARHDLAGTLHAQLTAVLAAHRQHVSPRTFGTLCQIVEESVQTFRRLKVFAAAKRFTVLIQSDASAAGFVRDAVASLETDVGMQFTLARMPLCRAVLSVSTVSNLLHDRTMNALNAGCVAIAEDNLAVSGLFTHGKNALLFRYDDDSLEECLDIVCNDPQRAFEIAQAGMRLRDDPRVRFGQFHNIIELAKRQVNLSASRAFA